MAGNDIDHLKQQRAKLHHMRRFRAIVASPLPQLAVEKSIAHCCSIGATCVRDLDLHPNMLATWVRELAAEPDFGTWRNARARAGVSDPSPLSCVA
jgi:hypothetical protein